MWLRVARECDDATISWELCLSAHTEMMRIVDELTRNNLLNKLGVSYEHLKVMVKAHQILHYVSVIVA